METNKKERGKSACMKPYKGTAALCLLVLLFLACSAAAVCDLSCQSSAVTLTAHTVFGDPAAAEGLTVLSRAQYRNHLYWEMAHCMQMNADRDFTLVESIKPVFLWNHSDLRDFWETEAFQKTSAFHKTGAALQSFAPLPQNAYGECELEFHNQAEDGIDLSEAENKTGVLFQTLLDTNTMEDFFKTETGRMFYDAATDPAQGLRAAYNRLYLDLLIEGGAEVSEEIFLCDYYGTYPITLHNGRIWSGSETEAERRCRAAVQSYFQIPVLKEDRVRIDLEENGSRTIHVGIATNVGLDSFYLTPYAAETEVGETSQTVYFTFDTHTTAGKVVDTSKIGNGAGYGIYRVRCDDDETNSHGIDASTIEQIYSLPMETYIRGLYLNAAETRLLLLSATEEDSEAVTLSVIDIENQTCIQMFSIPRGGMFPQVQIYEDYTVLFGDTCLTLLTEEDGIYTLEFTAEEPCDQGGTGMGNLLTRYNTVTALGIVSADGKKLAVAGNRSADGRSSLMPGYWIAIYEAGECVYYGEVHSSLDIGWTPVQNSDLQANIIAGGRYPLRLAWEKNAS